MVNGAETMPMSVSAALVLAAAASAPAAGDAPAQRVALAVARVTAQVLPSAAVRQATGPERADATAPRAQLSRRGTTILVEFE